MLRRIAVLLVSASLLLAACGGDGESDLPGGPGGGDGPGGLAGRLDAARCAEMVQAMSAAAAAVPQSFSGDASGLEESIAQLQAFAAAAPDEISDDLQTIYAGYADVMQAMADAGFDPTSGQVPDAETLAALEAAAQTLDTAEFQEAVDEVNAYFEQECG